MKYTLKNILASVMGASLVCVMLGAADALGATKCVYLDESMNCPYSSVTVKGPEFYATCTKGNVSTPIVGIGVCAAGINETSEELTISNDESENSKCYCKLISPGVGRYWVSGQGGYSGRSCANQCPDNCITMLTYYNRQPVAKFFSDLR